MKFLALVLLVALSVPAAALPGCGADCWLGQKEFRFTIPVGLVGKAIELVVKLVKPGFALPPGADLLIPDIEVTLHTEFSGEATVKCDGACCPGGRLYMGAELLLRGTAHFDFDGLPPRSSHFTSVIPVVGRLPDRYLVERRPGYYESDPPCGDRCDTNPSRCEIYTEWNYTKNNFKVALSFPVVGGVVRVPVFDSRGVGLTDCRTYWGCDDYGTRPVLVSWPDEVVVPIGGKAHFQVAATMSPYDRPLRYKLSPSWYAGVSLAITDDREENGKIIPGGQVTITVEKDAQIPDIPGGATEKLFITVEDPVTKRADQRYMTIRYVLNQPPQAISDGVTISHNESCVGTVRFAAIDPDLQNNRNNYGYQLYFVPLGMQNWDSSSAIDMYWHPSMPGTGGWLRRGQPGV